LRRILDQAHDNDAVGARAGAFPKERYAASRAADTAREKPFHPRRILIASMVRQERRITTIGGLRTTGPARHQLKAPKGTQVIDGVDDVPLLDELTTFVLHQIVQRPAAKLVLTVRHGEPIPVGIQELWKAGQFDRLDLRRCRRTKPQCCYRQCWAGPLTQMRHGSWGS
jgi:hypothetical protein